MSRLFNGLSGLFGFSGGIAGPPNKINQINQTDRPAPPSLLTFYLSRLTFHAPPASRDLLALFLPDQPGVALFSPSAPTPAASHSYKLYALSYTLLTLRLSVLYCSG